MWQRKQTIFMAIAAILMAVAAFIAYDIVLQIASGVIALMSGYSITLYTNRIKQSKWCLTGQVLLVLWLIYFAVRYVGGTERVSTIPLLMPIVSYIMLRLARAGIKHDNDLIKSADRIR